MSLLIPANLVDSMPEKLWWLGNVYRLFDRDLHFCTGGSAGSRTIELDGVEIGLGVRPFSDFVEEPADWHVSAEEMASLGDFIALLQRSLGRRVGRKPTHLLSLTGEAVPFEVAPSSDVQRR
jgi:hypothetical protein